MCPSCEGFGHEPEVFGYIVIPGKWQLHEHKSTAQYVSCFPDVCRYARPTVWMVCLCTVNPTLFRQVSCAETALVSLGNTSGISWHAGSPMRVCKCPTWTPEALSGAPESTVRTIAEALRIWAQEDTRIKTQILNRQLLVTKGMHLSSRQNPVWGMIGCDILSLWCPVDWSSHCWTEEGWCTRLGCDKSWIYFGRASYWKVSLLKLKVEAKKKVLFQKGKNHRISLIRSAMLKNRIIKLV